MREIRTSGSEGGGVQTNELSLPLSSSSHKSFYAMDPRVKPGGDERGCRSRRPRQRAVDHRDRVVEPVDRDERAEARALLLAEQHLIEHVEPVEGDAGLAVLGLDLAGLVEERLPPADLINDFLDLL